MVEIPSIDLDMRRWLKNLLVQIFGRPRGARILDYQARLYSWQYLRSYSWQYLRQYS
jgi:hypothetical protein